MTDPDGNTFEKSTSSSKEVVRNRPYRMGALEVVLETSQPNNVIYYTSTDGEIVTPYKTEAFGANIVSNTNENGQGIMTYDGAVTCIGNYAFKKCTRLASIIIPEGVASVGEGAFIDCIKLASIVIPESVTSIGKYAFSGCTSLTSIICKPETPPTGQIYMFYDTGDCPIYVRAGTVEAYKTVEYWSDYADRIQAIPEE